MYLYYKGVFFIMQGLYGDTTYIPGYFV